MNAKLVKAYLQQSTLYFSDSRGGFLTIKQMHRRYAANAARRLAMDASTWAADSGAVDMTASHAASDAWAYVITSPLYQALTEQAGLAR